ncbi:MAG: 50S ribosomal protein L4 [Anaerolineae bacterium]|nr:50S ribosomal protein L4 [Anaerolineae bacterium]
MDISVVNMAGKKVKTIELPADIFEYKINVGLMHQYVLMQQANARLGTHKTKRRGEVSRTTAKWYRQKGTGRARHGSRSAPIFVGGGRALGPVPHKYTKRMPLQMRHAALKSALSALARDGQLVMVDQVSFEQPKTKLAAAMVSTLVGEGTKTLIVLSGRNVNAEKAISNLEKVRYLHAAYINVRDLLNYDRVILSVDALEVIKTLLAKPAKKAAAS